MLFYLLLFTGLFGFVVWKGVKEKRHKEKPGIFAAIIFAFVCGLAALCIYLFMPHSDNILFFMVALMLGGLFIMLAVHNIASAFRCSEMVDGTYCGYNTYRGNNSASSSAPVFEYVYSGRKHHEQSAQASSRRKLDGMIRGGTYTIYVDPKHPASFVLDKKIKFGDVMLLLFGVLCIMVGAMALIG